MSDSLNVNVLVAAKEEYTKQLVYILSPEIYDVLLNVYSESQLLKKKRRISLRNFQIQLKKIPLWNNVIIEKNTSPIKTKIPYLLDLITAIFVSHVKILACVRLKTESKSIQVKVPNLDTFLHKIIITNAEKIYYNPELFLKKKEIVVLQISETIEETIRNQIPIDKILTEYLAGVFDEPEESNVDLSNTNKNEIESDEESENLEDDLSDHSSLNDLEPNKNIVPTRPLPESQLSQLSQLSTNAETNFENNTDEIINNIPTENIPTQNIPTENIQNKNRVLFSDAMEKSLKPKHNVSEESESEDDDELDFEDIESDDEEEEVKK